MLDNGFPFTTEPNSLKDLISPASFIQSVSSSMTGKVSTSVASALPDSRLSCTPWRTANAKYTKDEIFFDIIEEVDCIVDSNGLVVTSEIVGTITSLSKLSDTPDLSMVFNFPRVFTDVSFHPCVRFSRWEQNRVVSFIPPDGSYNLMHYRINTPFQPPVYCKPQLSFSEGVGKFNAIVGIKNNGGKAVEEVKITIPFPKSVLTVNLTPSFGKIAFDEVTKVMATIRFSFPSLKPTPLGVRVGNRPPP